MEEFFKKLEEISVENAKIRKAEMEQKPFVTSKDGRYLFPQN